MNFICKRIFAFLTLACGMSFSYSALASVALTVYSNQSENPIYKIILEDKPVVTFTNGGLHIVATNENYVTAEFDLPFEEMPRFEFAEADQTQDIEKVEDEQHIPFRFEFTDGQTVLINGLSETERISVFGIDGRQRPAEIERRTYCATVHLDQLPKGYYIIKTEKHSFKIYKK